MEATAIDATAISMIIGDNINIIIAHVIIIKGRRRIVDGIEIGSKIVTHIIIVIVIVIKVKGLVEYAIIGDNIIAHVIAM